jgi:hypothetical protein
MNPQAQSAGGSFTQAPTSLLSLDHARAIAQFESSPRGLPLNFIRASFNRDRRVVRHSVLLTSALPIPQPADCSHYLLHRYQPSATSEQSQHFTPYVNAIIQLIRENRVTSARILLASAIGAGQSLTEGLLQWSRALAEPVARPIPQLTVDRSADYEWLRQNRHRYRGRWVAIVGGYLLVDSARFADVLAVVTARSLERVALIHRVA